MNTRAWQITSVLGLALAAQASLGCGGSNAYRASRTQSASDARSAPASASRSAPASAESYSDSARGLDGDSGSDVGDYSPGEVQRQRPGLGTEFGEQIGSRITHTRFERASADAFAQVAIHYNDEEGVRAQAEFSGMAMQQERFRTPHGGLSIALTEPSGRVLPGLHGAGRHYVIGQDGARYNIMITNDTGGRYEVVGSVDGLDVIDGQPAGYAKRGYIIKPYETITIDGFRTSDATVAAFRFGAVSESYAARTGSDRNVGVIGLAFFAERGSQWTSDELQRRESADPFPNRYAQPPTW